MMKKSQNHTIQQREIMQLLGAANKHMYHPMLHLSHSFFYSIKQILHGHVTFDFCPGGEENKSLLGLDNSKLPQHRHQNFTPSDFGREQQDDA
jgi:hypothetical protein